MAPAHLGFTGSGGDRHQPSDTEVTVMEVGGSVGDHVL